MFTSEILPIPLNGRIFNPYRVDSQSKVDRFGEGLFVLVDTIDAIAQKVVLGVGVLSQVPTMLETLKGKKIAFLLHCPETNDPARKMRDQFVRELES